MSPDVTRFHFPPLLSRFAVPALGIGRRLSRNAAERMKAAVRSFEGTGAMLGGIEVRSMSAP
jgi:hypothetical protein